MKTELPPRLMIEAVYVDGSMVELETSFTSRHWSARATAYTEFVDVAAFASRLARFAETLTGEASFTAGREDSSIGFLSLRFYPSGRTGHLACHLRLAAEAANDYRPEELWSVAVELNAAAPALETFAAGLTTIAATQRGRAVLDLTE